MRINSRAGLRGTAGTSRLAWLSTRWGQVWSRGGRLIAAVAAVLLVAALFSRSTAQEVPPIAGTPVITSVQVDVAQQMLTINGVNFGAQAPTVSLALASMEVATPATDSLVQATLATLSTLAPGTYRLVLQRADAVMADFPVTIGAVGPPGPPGLSVPVYQ